ncbi:MAG: CpaF family protein [Candidatus Diapherotrites archaeon]|uniref:CpaF family protein n=1 Tax=Candidatus Iainarchaeum sp. TaxID=3101447 RepID=A0A8T5GF84_9ARCH|nr:CpaF family protein [Candidatus Diapherotrites archaeon]MBT7240898.1 CpaF family protein [Candidatus Diapherotrites archaeon]
MSSDYLSEMMQKAKKADIKEATPEQKEEETVKEVRAEDLEKLKQITDKKIPELEIGVNTEKNEVEKELATKRKVELKAYGKTKIFKIPGSPMNYYYVPTLRPTPSERKIINTIKEATTRLVSIAPYKIRNPEERRVIYKQKVLEIIKHNPTLKIPNSRASFYAEAVVREMVGYGLIDDLINDDQLEEIMVVGPKKPVFVFHREFEMMNTNIEFISEQEVEDLVNKIAREVGRRVDVASPLLDARLSDGSRVNATIPPASISGGTLTIRKFRADPYSIIDLIRMETISTEAAAFLWMCVDGLGVKPANMLISGGTGSGKTTLLNVLASFVPTRERIVSIEDTAELNLPLKHWIRLEARPPGLEGSGELKMDILTKNSLRMRPDRIIVGEIRHEEAFTLFTAINTGHDGCLGTVHANSPEETLIRVTSPPMNVPQIMLAGLDLVIVEHRYYDRKKGTIRRLSQIAEVYGGLEGKPKTNVVFERDPVKDKLERTLLESNYLKELQKFTGLSKSKITAELEIRKRFLDKLVEQNIRDMQKVSDMSRDFLVKRENFGEL